MKNNKLTCLFGHHDYSKRLSKDKSGYLIYLCKVCKRSGYWDGVGNSNVLCDYDGGGNLIHEKYPGGAEYWYDRNEKGDMIHTKWNGENVGGERWKANNGYWVKTKPENWKYDTQ